MAKGLQDKWSLFRKNVGTKTGEVSLDATQLQVYPPPPIDQNVELTPSQQLRLVLPLALKYLTDIDHTKTFYKPVQVIN